MIELSCEYLLTCVAWSRCKILSLSDSNWTRTHNHLVHKWTLNHLIKLDIYWTFSMVHLTVGSCHVMYVFHSFTYPRIDKYSQHSSIIWPLWLNSWPVWLNGWVFVYELSGCGPDSSCNHLNLRFCTCFK